MQDSTTVKDKSLNVLDNITSGVGNMFKHYFNFEGRICRKTFWFGILGIVLVLAVFYLVGILSHLSIFFKLFCILGAIIAVPVVTSCVRRIHDLGKNGFWVCLFAVPVLGWIYLIVLFCKKGTDEENKFGPSPASEIQFQ